MEKLQFRKVDGTLIEDIEKYVKNWTVNNPYGKVIIGCDSQIHGRRIKYSIAICMHYVDKMGAGHGAHVILADIWEKRVARTPIEEMPSKLWKEAEYVLAAAQMVDGSDEAFRKRITLHLDYNEDVKHESNKMFASGIGFLHGMGYKAEGKPHAYAASHTADHFVK